MLIILIFTWVEWRI